jgi:anti-sigma factor RsiW
MRDHLSCREMVELVTDYLDHALPSETAALFEEHINFCDGCAAHLVQMRTTIAAVGRIAEDDVPPEARERLLAAFRHWKRP